MRYGPDPKNKKVKDSDSEYDGWARDTEDDWPDIDVVDYDKYDDDDEDDELLDDDYEDEEDYQTYLVEDPN